MTLADIILNKTILPTSLNSDELLAQVSAEVRRESFFTSCCTERKFLEPLQQACADFAEEIISMDEFQTRMLAVLDRLGYAPERGGWPNDPNNNGTPLKGMKNLRGKQRLKLIAETQRDMAKGLAQYKGWRVEKGTQFDRGPCPYCGVEIYITQTVFNSKTCPYCGKSFEF